MTTHARTVNSSPARSALETWNVIVDILCHSTQTAEARSELENIRGVMASIISGETLRDHPLVLMGSGPRVKVYCIYDEDAMTGERARETHLTHDPFASDDWSLSAPCPPEDKDWVERALTKAPHVSIRLPEDPVERPVREKAEEVTIDKEAFFRS